HAEGLRIAASNALDSRSSQIRRSSDLLAAPLRTKLELRRPDVLSLPALRSLGDIELHCLAFLQAAEAARLDCRKMHEYIFAGLTANKAVALGVIEPLYCSCFH